MAEEKRQNRKRLSVDIPSGIHDHINIISIKHNCTVTKIVLRALIELIKREEQYK